MKGEVSQREGSSRSQPHSSGVGGESLDSTVVSQKGRDPIGLANRKPQPEVWLSSMHNWSFSLLITGAV